MRGRRKTSCDGLANNKNSYLVLALGGDLTSGQCDQIWQNFKSLWLFFEGLFCIGKFFEPNWVNLNDIGQILIVVNSPILKR